MINPKKKKLDPVDKEDRRIIVEEIDKNIFVEAGAGSGKTRSLVERMVMMIRKGRDVSQICAITFTKAAAIEFYNRFETMLSEAINSDEINEEEKNRCKKALLNIDLCFMGTIDAFCNMVLSENPIEAGIPLNSSIVEEKEYKFLIADEYNNIINNISIKEEKDALDDFLRFQTNPKEAFTECVNKLLTKRNYSLDVKDRKTIQDREKAFYAKYKDEIQRLVDGIAVDKGKYFHEGKADSRNAKEYILTNSWQISDNWEEYPISILKFFKKGLCPIHLKENIPTLTKEFNEYFELSPSGEFYQIIDKKMEEVVGEFESIRADYTLAFVNQCVKKVSKNLIEKGKMSFFDNLLLFRDLLKNDIKNGGELIKHINKRHKYYFIDEFQDTDPLQSEIVFYLTALTPNEDFTKCKPAPGTLFIVGDPKQSIYRFRNADVLAYDFIKKLFIQNGDEFVELTTNFRSHKKLVNYFNAEFKLLFSDLYRGLQAPFNKVEYYPDNKKPTKAGIEGVYKYNSKNTDDPKLVSNLIVNLTKKGYKYGDIMVLTNSKPKLKNYIEAFEEKSIPYEIQGQSVFDKCEVFVNLCYLLGAVANPDNSYYVYKALKKIYKMSDSNIYSIYNPNKPTLLNKTNNKKVDKLVDFINNNKNEDIIVVFDRLIDEFDLMKISDVKHLEYLYYSKELLRERNEEGKIVTLKEAHKYLKEITKKNIVERCLSLTKLNKDEEEKDNRVLLANVHKVKGLERKIVVLTSDYRNVASDPANRVDIHSSFKDQKNYVIRITSSADQDSFVRFTYLESADYQSEQQDEADALLCESDRIAYVAATRAIDALFISTNSLNKEKKNKTPWGKLILPDAVEEYIQIDDTLFQDSSSPSPKEVESSSLETEVAVFDSSFTDTTYKIKSPSKLVNIIEENAISNTINNDATLKGTIIHRLLELYVSNNFNDTLDTYLSIINNEFLLDNKYDELLKNVYNTMKYGGYKQDSGKITDLIRELKGSDEIITEVPFAYNDGGDIYNGIIDLLYKKNNKWVIVDYKTNLDDKELDKKYENQLEGYKKALQAQGIEADAYIYHIDIK